MKGEGCTNSTITFKRTYNFKETKPGTYYLGFYDNNGNPNVIDTIVKR